MRKYGRTLRKSKKKMKSISTEIDRLNPKYVAASNALGNAISNSHFKILNKNELKTNIENNIAQLRESSESTRIKITRYRRELDDAKDKIADRTYRKRSEVLNQMDQLLSKTTQTQTDIQSALAELLKPQTLRSRNEIWTGKNTTTEINVKKIQDGISQIKEAQAVFNKLAAAPKGTTEE